MGVGVYSSQFENNYFTEMCSGSEVGSYLRLIDFVYHSALGWRVIKKKFTGYGLAIRMTWRSAAAVLKFTKVPLLQ